MTVKELSNNVYRQTGISPERCQIVIESFIDELKKAMLSDEKIIFQNFGSFFQN